MGPSAASMKGNTQCITSWLQSSLMQCRLAGPCMGVFLYIYIYYLRLQTTWAKITTAVISTCTWCAVCQWYVPISPVYTVLMWNRCILPSTLAWASWKYTWCQNLIPSTARWYHILAGLWEVCKLCKATQTTLAATTIAEITYTKLQCAWSVLTCGLLFDIVSLIFVLVCFIAFIHFCIAEARLQVFANPEQIGDIVECMLTLDHRDIWMPNWPYWVPHQRFGDWLARFLLALEQFRICTRLNSFDNVSWSEI